MVKKYEIKMSDGTIRDVEIEDYDAKDIAKELNNADKNMVALGSVIVQRFSVLRVMPSEVEEE